MASILVLTSSTEEREGLAFITEMGGHRCHTAGTILEAVGELQHATIDLVIAECEGSALRPLRRTFPNTKVLLLVERGIHAPDSGPVLRIPCSPSDLFRRIDFLLNPQLPKPCARVLENQPRPAHKLA